MVAIKESGVIFGDYPEDDCYLIENSKGHNSLKDGFKIVEFTYLNKEKLYFVEAKSSIPNPSKSKKDYEEFWDEIAEKFHNALTLQLMAAIKRNAAAANELPANHKLINWQTISLELRLVIPKVPTEFLPPMTDKFRKKLSRFGKLWAVNQLSICVLNEEKARNQKLIK